MLTLDRVSLLLATCAQRLAASNPPHSHRGISRAVRVQGVAGTAAAAVRLKIRAEAGGLGIAGGGVEIDHAVEQIARSSHWRATLPSTLFATQLPKSSPARRYKKPLLLCFPSGTVHAIIFGDFQRVSVSLKSSSLTS